jgi:hypothetical protein
VKIAELYAVLGFDIKGASDLKEIEANLSKAAMSSAKLAAGAGVVAAAISGMVYTALSAAVGFQKFNLTTGLSTTELQKWLYQAQLANVSGAELTQTVKNIQMAGVRVSSTGEGYGAWALLGIDPRQNPFRVLEQLGRELRSIDESRRAAARFIVSQAGIYDEILQMSMRPPAPPLPPGYIVNPKELAALQQLNQDWQRTTFLADQLKNKISGDLAPAYDRMLQTVEKGEDLMARFIGWLESGTPAANTMKTALQYLTIGITALAGALTVLAIAQKVGAIAAGLFNIALFPEIAAAVAVAGAIYGVAKSVEWLIAKYHDLRGETQAPMGSPMHRGRYPLEAMPTASSTPIAPGKPWNRVALSDVLPEHMRWPSWLGTTPREIGRWLTTPGGAGARGGTGDVTQSVLVQIDGKTTQLRAGDKAKVDTVDHQITVAALSAQVPTS